MKIVPFSQSSISSGCQSHNGQLRLQRCQAFRFFLFFQAGPFTQTQELCDVTVAVTVTSLLPLLWRHCHCHRMRNDDACRSRHCRCSRHCMRNDHVIDSCMVVSLNSSVKQFFQMVMKLPESVHEPRYWLHQQGWCVCHHLRTVLSHSPERQASIPWEVWRECISLSKAWRPPQRLQHINCSRAKEHTASRTVRHMVSRSVFESRPCRFQKLFRVCFQLKIHLCKMEPSPNRIHQNNTSEERVPIHE